MRAALILGCLLTCIASAGARADAPGDAASPCEVHLILFVPSDAQPPAGYQRRVDQIVDYTESFFRRELKRWGHAKVVMPFRRRLTGTSR
jgi:hypothetical protein